MADHTYHEAYGRRNGTGHLPSRLGADISVGDGYRCSEAYVEMGRCRYHAACVRQRRDARLKIID